MAITMTICAAIGVLITSNIIVGAVVGACIGAMLALTVLYKIDPTVEPIVKLFGITDKDVITGYVTVNQIYENSFPNEVQTRLILDYMKNQQSSKEYILGYAQYGDNQLRLFKSSCNQYLESFIKPFDDKIAKLTTRLNNTPATDTVTREALQTQIDKAKEDKNSYNMEVIVSTNGLNQTQVITMLKTDLGINDNIQIDSSYISLPDDTLWCKYQLQLKYGYNYETDMVIINNTEYQYSSETYNEDTNNFTIQLFTVVKTNTNTYETTYKTLTITNFNGVLYGVVRYKINNKTYLWIKPVKEEINSSNKITSYMYTLSDGSKYTLRTKEARSYINTYPVVCFKHNDHYLSEYSTVTDDPYVNESVYNGTKKILKKIGINLETLEDNFKNSPNTEQVTHAFFAWGIPFTTRTEKDKDNTDFKEPEILSKVLYTIFDTLNNNITFSTMNLVTDINNEDQPTATLTYTQNPYYSSLIWVPVQDIQSNEVIGNPGTYTHTVYSTEMKRIQVAKVMWYKSVYNSAVSDNESDYYTYSYKYKIDTTVIGNGVVWNKSIGSTSYSTGVKLDLFTSNIPTAVIDDKIRIPIKDNNGNYIFGKYYSYYKDYLLITKDIDNETKLYGIDTNKQEHFIQNLVDGKFHITEYDSEGSYDSYIVYSDLPDDILSKYVTMERNTVYETVAVDIAALAMVSMTKQISSTTTNTITIASPTYFTVVSKDSDSAIIASNNILETDSNVILPLPIDILDVLTLQEKTALFALSARIVSYVLNKQHLKWYETEEYAKFTKAVCIVAIIVITIVTWGTGTKGALSLMSVLKTLLYKAMVMVALSLVLKGIALVVKNPVLRAVLSAVAMIAAASVSGYIDTGSFTSAFSMTVPNAISFANMSINAINIGVTANQQSIVNRQQSINNKFDSLFESEEYNDLQESINKINANLSATDILDINNMGIYSLNIEPSVATYSPSLDTRVSMALEDCYDFSRCFTYPEDCVYQALDFRKSINFNE